MTDFLKDVASTFEPTTLWDARVVRLRINPRAGGMVVLSLAQGSSFVWRATEFPFSNKWTLNLQMVRNGLIADIVGLFIGAALWEKHPLPFGILLHAFDLEGHWYPRRITFARAKYRFHCREERCVNGHWGLTDDWTSSPNVDGLIRLLALPQACVVVASRTNESEPLP